MVAAQEKINRQGIILPSCHLVRSTRASTKLSPEIHGHVEEIVRGGPAAPPPVLPGAVVVEQLHHPDAPARGGAKLQGEKSIG
jgi:hypothetical protein